MSTTIQVRVDEELKMKSDMLFKELGTDTTSAIRIFLTQAVDYNGFPFEIKKKTKDPYQPLTEEDMLSRLATARMHAEEGRYREADAVLSDVRAKYGL
ncbi:MAG: type II toxin-antitoxin system RelB/DinJ family antitoxin [Lachnospiraceae bacterium]|nr:type II toxin-antitoxin system RelB/DinJ family antitoxin [Lachnospiraceae bacterium]